MTRVDGTSKSRYIRFASDLRLLAKLLRPTKNSGPQMPRRRPSVDELRCRFSYNPETGELAPKGEQPPARKRKGYWACYVDGNYILAHIIIFAIVTGEYPTTTIDHQDRDGLNNRWDNLRPAVQAQQQANRGLFKNNKSGYRGVYAVKNHFEAFIRFDKKTKYLGYFHSAEEAAAAVQKAREARWGEFASAA